MAISKTLHCNWQYRAGSFKGWDEKESQKILTNNTVNESK
jgi:hypothetical protein